MVASAVLLLGLLLLGSQHPEEESQGAVPSFS
jgi:hypothetical protein